jgi:hypothetical protein
MAAPRAMAARTRFALLALLVLLAGAQAQSIGSTRRRVPCNITIEQALEVAGWKVTGPRGPGELIMECSPSGSVISLYLVFMNLVGNLTGLNPFMKDMVELDLTFNRLTGKF